MEGELRNWPPHAQPAQKQNACHESRYASSERKQHGFGEQLAQNAIAARTKSQAQGHFARRSAARARQQAAQVGQAANNQTRKKHQSVRKARVAPPNSRHEDQARQRIDALSSSLG